jgi:hypothetical protein
MDVNCDAPPYRVVEACAALGFQAPLDVRWCQMRNFLAEKSGQVGRPFWEKFFHKGQPIERNCICGQSLPRLESYTFTFSSERKAIYFLGQCRQCQTIYWEEE